MIRAVVSGDCNCSKRHIVLLNIKLEVDSVSFLKLVSFYFDCLLVDWTVEGDLIVGVLSPSHVSSQGRVIGRGVVLRIKCDISFGTYSNMLCLLELDINLLVLVHINVLGMACDAVALIDNPSEVEGPFSAEYGRQEHQARKILIVSSDQLVIEVVHTLIANGIQTSPQITGRVLSVVRVIEDSIQRYLVVDIEVLV